jgi:uncharacterized protein with HEPN domain
MPRDKDDAAYLWDMLDAARVVVELTADFRYEEYLKDRRTQLAVERALEIVGEAARHVSEAVKDAHPEIPWSKIVRHRHVLAHEYGELKSELIWIVVRRHTPELIRQLEPLVPPGPPRE